MKLKVVIVDLEIPTRLKRLGLRIAVLAVVLLGGGAIAYAAGLVTWSSGQTLRAADLNNNFSYLQEEIAALQGQVHPPSAFRATLSNATNVPNNTAVQVVFDNVLFDLGGEYDAATGVFAPKNAGTYLVMCNLEMSVSSSSSSSWDVTINDGQTRIIETVVQASTNAGSMATATLTQLAAGDAVTCWADQWNSPNLALYLGTTGEGQNTFSVARLY